MINACLPVCELALRWLSMCVFVCAAAHMCGEIHVRLSDGGGEKKSIFHSEPARAETGNTHSLAENTGLI